MIRTRFTRFAQQTLFTVGFALAAGASGSHAISNDQLPPKPYPDSRIPRVAIPGTLVPSVAHDLSVRIKKVTCFDGHVSVKLRLQNLQNGNVGITVPFETVVKVGGDSAIIPSGASPQNPWYNGQEKGANLFPGYGTFQVSAKIDHSDLLPETNPNNNEAPSAQNGFDSNPDPLFVTCEKPAEENANSSETKVERSVRASTKSRSATKSRALRRAGR